MKKINLILLLCFASVFCSCDEKYIDGIRPDYICLEIGEFSYSKGKNGLFKANINANNSQEKRTIKIHLGNGLYRFSHFTLIQAGVK